MSIFVIVGPTGSGKSDYAIKLAREINGEIISADSRQVYRGMDIGTGKVPRDAELAACNLQRTTNQKPPKQSSKKLPVVSRQSYVSNGIRHHLLDVASPKRSYTVTHFLRDAKAAIEDIKKRSKVPIVCGGTNFWIEALVFDTEFPEVKPDPILRKELGRLTAPELFTLLQEKDPDRAETIDRHNKVRLIRALEIVATMGKVPNTTFDIRHSKNRGFFGSSESIFRKTNCTDVSKKDSRKGLEREWSRRFSDSTNKTACHGNGSKTSASNTDGVHDSSKGNFPVRTWKPHSSKTANTMPNGRYHRCVDSNATGS